MCHNAFGENPILIEKIDEILQRYNSFGGRENEDPHATFQRAPCVINNFHFIYKFRSLVN